MSRRTDRVSLAFGVLFLGLPGLWLATRWLDLPVLTVGWIVAGGLVVLGLAGIAGVLTSTHRRHAEGPDR
jgi:hypothetical protein